MDSDQLILSVESQTWILELKGLEANDLENRDARTVQMSSDTIYFASGTDSDMNLGKTSGPEVKAHVSAIFLPMNFWTSLLLPTQCELKFVSLFLAHF